MFLPSYCSVATGKSTKALISYQTEDDQEGRRRHLFALLAFPQGSSDLLVFNRALRLQRVCVNYSHVYSLFLACFIWMTIAQPLTFSSTSTSLSVCFDVVAPLCLLLSCWAGGAAGARFQPWSFGSLSLAGSGSKGEGRMAWQALRRLRLNNMAWTLAAFLGCLPKVTMGSK